MDIKTLNKHELLNTLTNEEEILTGNQTEEQLIKNAEALIRELQTKTLPEGYRPSLVCSYYSGSHPEYEQGDLLFLLAAPENYPVMATAHLTDRAPRDLSFRNKSYDHMRYVTAEEIDKLKIWNMETNSWEKFSFSLLNARGNEYSMALQDEEYETPQYNIVYPPEAESSYPYLKDNQINIGKLAEFLGKTPQKRTLPNGKVVEQIVWDGSDMVDISMELHNNDKITHASNINIDGAAPAWLVAGIAHECHPAPCTVTTSQGNIAIGCRTPQGEGQAENIKFTIAKDDWTTIHMEQINPSQPLNLEDISSWTPPEIEMGSKIILSGRMPNVAMASLGQAYQHKAKAVAFLQPGTGSTVSITHDPKVRLGDIIPESKIKNKTDRAKKLNNLNNQTVNTAIKI